jgi:hypothetical protein
VNQRTWGFRAPPDLAWQMGKSGVTIRFVKEGEEFLSSLPLAKFSLDIEQRHEALRDAIEKIKLHGHEVHQECTVETFLASPSELN